LPSVDNINDAIQDRWWSGYLSVQWYLIFYRTPCLHQSREWGVSWHIHFRRRVSSTPDCRESTNVWQVLFNAPFHTIRFADLISVGVTRHLIMRLRCCIFDPHALSGVRLCGCNIRMCEPALKVLPAIRPTCASVCIQDWFHRTKSKNRYEAK
jgi:hypothetical protein